MNKIAPNPRPAYSLIFAFIFMTAILIVATSAIVRSNQALQNSNDGMVASAKADQAAEGAADYGITSIKDANDDGEKDWSPGFEYATPELFCPEKNGTDCVTWASTQVWAEARPVPYTDEYYVPIFGTGSAGNSRFCDVLDYLDEETGEVRTDVTIEPDSMCHWNKIMANQSVTIPLFDTVDSVDDTIDSTHGLGSTKTLAFIDAFNGFKLRLRTPCNDGTRDSTCERYELNEDGEITGEGDTVLFWQLIGIDADGDTTALIPDDGREYDPTPSIRALTRNYEPINTEVYESLINDAYFDSSFTVLAPYTDPRYDALFDFVSDTNLVKTYLQLNIVTPLKDVSDEPIPYLEWQLIVDAAGPIADGKSISFGLGYAKGSAHTYTSTKRRTVPTIGVSSNVYTLSN